MAGFTYKSYSFVDKDPLIDYIRTVIQDSKYSIMFIANVSGVSPQTINNWLYGETKRPQAASLNAVLRACDYKIDISHINTPMMIIPTAYIPTPTVPKARKRMGAAKYSNVHHISVHKKRKK
jgi:transcriptional regulator with XRE-family HTH domain